MCVLLDRSYEVATSPTDGTAPFACMASHTSFTPATRHAVLDGLVPAVQWLTVLRSPWRRLLSIYFHVVYDHDRGVCTHVQLLDSMWCTADRPIEIYACMRPSIHPSIATRHPPAVTLITTLMQQCNSNPNRDTALLCQPSTPVTSSTIKPGHGNQVQTSTISATGLNTAWGCKAPMHVYTKEHAYVCIHPYTYHT